MKGNILFFCIMKASNASDPDAFETAELYTELYIYSFSKDNLLRRMEE
jgi:hypothetical protein